MKNKVVPDVHAAVAGITDGSSVMIGGFGGAGAPVELVHALVDLGAKDLTLINNNAGNGRVGLAALIAAGRVRKMICSFPRSTDAEAFTTRYLSGDIELELVPQGTLAERIRAGGAGIPAFYTATAFGTPLAEGKETRQFGSRGYVLEHGLTADFALVKAREADEEGNLLYNKTGRNFGPVMCAAARCTIVQAARVGPRGAIDPEQVVTPGIFVHRVVEVPEPVQEEDLVTRGVHYV